MNRNFLTGMVVGLFVSTLVFGGLNSRAAEETNTEDPAASGQLEAVDTAVQENDAETVEASETLAETAPDAKGTTDKVTTKAGEELAPDTGTNALVEYELPTTLQETGKIQNAPSPEALKNAKPVVVYKTPASCKEFTLYIDAKAVKLEAKEQELIQKEKMIEVMQEQFVAMVKRYADTETRIKKLIKYDPTNLRDNPELAKMIRLYESLTPEEAATRLKNLDLDLTLAILKGMKPKILSKVMTALDPKISAALSSQMVRGF